MKNASRSNRKLEAITYKTIVVGIDIAKSRQWARFVDYRGMEIGKAVSFNNDREGFEYIVSEIRTKIKMFDAEKVFVGMEPTGHYWKPLANYLMKQNITVVLVNPYHTKKAKELGSAEKALRQQKPQYIKYPLSFIHKIWYNTHIADDPKTGAFYQKTANLRGA